MTVRRCSVCSETGHNARTCGKEKKPVKVKSAPYVEPRVTPIAVGCIVAFSPRNLRAENSSPRNNVVFNGIITNVVSERDMDAYVEVEWLNAEAPTFNTLNFINYSHSWRIVS